jgi:hypothetical protein
LPNTICTRCKIILTNAYKFKQVCKRADTMLKMYPITKTIPPKDEEKLPVKEFSSIGVGVEFELKEVSSQTDFPEIEPVSLNYQITECNMESLPIIPPPPPPEEFMDAEIVYAEEDQQFEMIETEETETKPKVYEKVKILNKGTSDKFPVQAKQFKKPQNPVKIEKIQISKPKILNNELLAPKITEPLSPVAEEIQIIAYENAEYLDETSAPKVIDDKSEDGVVYTCDVCERSFPLLQQLEIHKVKFFSHCNKITIMIFFYSSPIMSVLGIIRVNIVTKRSFQSTI